MKWMTVAFLQASAPFCFGSLKRTSFLFHPYIFVFSGGPVPQVGVTINMDDGVLNGTNRVVLDGVMTEKECDTILQLATVSFKF